MLAFSKLAAQFPGVSSVTLQCKRGGRAAKAEKLIRLHGTPSAIFDTFNTLLTDNAEFQRYCAPDRSEPWAGFTKGETPRSLITTRTLPSALEATKKATAALSAPLVRATPQASFVGASFNVGRLIQGHPKACYIRPRAKLPAKNIEFFAGYSSSVKAEDLAPIFASISRSITDYTIRGGIVTVRLNVLTGFALPNEGHTGLVVSVDIPMGNLSALSAICSTAFDRSLNLALGQTLSGQRNDSLPVLIIAEKGRHQITGDPDTDRATLKALNIEGGPA